ncbi:GAF domain-containing protein (plasmid) [Paraburkholderia sprentiae WSM5005]|uniref:GAF domain-containing protein n=1 Tax=Paraburkholderia sprentiae WSM5005 TaxID=754502 RepID=A0A1I9YUX7_9BURK|nr:histidine kinase [Paraburkholderia sprentiae]APA89991.1 GAF domain-containing protein [Paraburkholderia sprentiae WSM5005]
MQGNLTEPAAHDTQMLDSADLERLALAMRVKDQPLQLFRAVHAAAEKTIGLSLFTIMSYDAQRHEVERVYTNMPDVYPLGGRKQKQGTAWARQILHDLKPFRAATSQGIREAFDDHAVMTGLGLGSILNIPIAYDGVCIGTMNLTHEEGWYTSRHESIGLLIGAFLVPALLKQNAASSACAVRS